MKTNTKLLIINIILILFILGCSGGISIGSKKKSAEADVRAGFNGLTMEFLKNTPPVKVFEGDIFPVIIKVRNNGAFNLFDNDKAVLSLGVEKDYTKNVKLLESGRVTQAVLEDKSIPNAATFNLEGRSKINSKGEEEVISYNVEAGKIDPQSEAHSSTVVATLCYPYNTILDTTVCIDTDISNIRPGKKVCKAQDLVFNNGQGAPVAVTKIEVNILPQVDEQKVKPQFLIFIENKGRGTVIKKDVAKDFCTKGDTTHKNINVINARAFLSNEELDCTPKEKENANEKQALVKLKDKKELARCTLKDGVSSSLDPYLSPLRIELNYGYSQSILGNYFIQKTVR